MMFTCELKTNQYGIERANEMIDVKDLSALEKAVASRISLDAESRKALAPGVYPVNFVQKVSGKITVGADTSRTRACNLLGKRVLALCLHYMGAQEKNVAPILDKILEQAVSGDTEFIDTLEHDPRIVKAMKKLDAGLAKAEKLPVKGKILSDLVFTTVDL
jgi:hypothetical protein